MENKEIQNIRISERVEKLFLQAQEARFVHKWSKLVNKQLSFWKKFVEEEGTLEIVKLLAKQILNEFEKDFFSFLNRKSLKHCTDIIKAENRFIIKEFNTILDNVVIESEEHLIKLAKTLDYFLSSANEFKNKKDIEYFVYLRSLPTYIRLDLELNNLIKYPPIKITQEFKWKFIEVEKEYTYIKASISNIKELLKETPYQATSLPPTRMVRYFKRNLPIGV